jgi:hypothetical protein
MTPVRRVKPARASNEPMVDRESRSVVIVSIRGVQCTESGIWFTQRTLSALLAIPGRR